MSIISAPVNDARAVLDEDTGEFAIEVRLANGAEVRFASTPDPETLASLREALTTPAPEPVKPKRRRARKTPSAPTES